MRQDVEHVVIGGGISGLGMAHHSAKRGISTMLLEGSDRVGGCINSRIFPGCGHFWTEGGTHTCFNSYGHLLDILSDLDLLGRLIPKGKLRYFLWRGGQRKSVFSSLHPLELAVSLPRLFGGTKAYKGVAEYYRRTLGHRNYRDLFGPAFRAVICQQADDFPADLLFRRKPRRKEIVRSFTFSGGLSDIPQAIAGQDALEVRTGLPASGVSWEDDGYRILMADGSEIRSCYLTLAVLPNVAVALLGEGLDELRNLARSIGISRIETVVLCIAAGELGHLPPLAGLISVDDAFYSMVTRDYLPETPYRGFAFHFRHGALDADAQMKRICQVLGIEAEQIAGISRVSNQLPVLRAGHLDLVGKMDAFLAGSRLAMTGNWFFGVSVEDCLTRSYQEFERLFVR